MSRLNEAHPVFNSIEALIHTIDTIGKIAMKTGHLAVKICNLGFQTCDALRHQVQPFIQTVDRRTNVPQMLNDKVFSFFSHVQSG